MAEAFPRPGHGTRFRGVPRQGSPRATSPLRDAYLEAPTCFGNGFTRGATRAEDVDRFAGLPGRWFSDGRGAFYRLKAQFGIAKGPHAIDKTRRHVVEAVVVSEPVAHDPGASQRELGQVVRHGAFHPA
jgi:hypothetical protein